MLARTYNTYEDRSSKETSEKVSVLYKAKRVSTRYGKMLGTPAKSKVCYLFTNEIEASRLERVTLLTFSIH